MKKSVFSIFLFTILSATSFAQGDAKNIAEDISDETNLLLVSDIHIGELGQQENELYSSVITALKKSTPKLDCIFLEQPQDLQVFLDFFYQSKITWEQYSEQAVKAIKAQQSSSFWEERATKETSSMLEFFQNKKSIATTARNLGLKIIAVDSKTKTIATDSGEQRSDVMAHKIISVLKKNQCKLAFFPVGAWHIIGFPTIQSIVRAYGFKTNVYKPVNGIHLESYFERGEKTMLDD